MSDVVRRVQKVISLREQAIRRQAEMRGQINATKTELKKLGVNAEDLATVIADLEISTEKKRKKLEKALTVAEGVLDEYESSR